jgi:hypothetical protein
MKKNIPIGLFWFIVFLFPLLSLAEGPAAVGELGIVTAPLANVHEEPLPKSGLETQVLMGDEVRVLDRQDNRYRISIPSQGHREGWVQLAAVQIPRDGGNGFLNGSRVWIVITKPKTEALILDRTGNHKVALYAGTRLPVLEQTAPGQDYKVLFPDRSHAIINASDAMPARTFDPLLSDLRPEELSRTAALFQGARHQSGGITAQGLDTSGLIYITYRIHGIAADPEALGAQAVRVSKKDLEAGDVLVLYGEDRGLYTGNGRFLHVPRKGTVRYAGIHDRRYARSLQYGLRVVGAGPDGKKRPLEMTADEMLLSQARAAQLAPGKRIAYWAGRFIGTPYDPDPLGLYVRKNRIVADEKVDCMYHAFRSVELAQSASPGEAIDRALSLRFLTQGRLADGIVVNYDERYQYGEDMVFSEKWGRNVTADLGNVATIPGSRGRETVEILPKNVLATGRLQKKLADGDIVFWVKDPNKRVVGEIVAHLSIVRIKAGKAYLIHAAGDKDREGKPGGGVVKELPFADYVRNMRFIGAFVTRFEQ